VATAAVDVNDSYFRQFIAVGSYVATNPL